MFPCQPSNGAEDNSMLDANPSEPLPHMADDVAAAGALPRAELRAAEAAVRFALAGDAHVTFQSERTGTHFTYNIRAAGPSGVVSRNPVTHFVHVLTGPDHYEYIGHVYESMAFAHGARSRIAVDAPSVTAFAWVWAQLARGQMPRSTRVFHEGTCGKCGRRLTTPESIESGIGPKCAGRS